MDRIAVTRLAPVLASVLIHAGIVWAAALAPVRPAPRVAVLIDLIEPEPPAKPEPPPPPPPPPPRVDKRPLTLPKPIETPMPVAPRVVETPEPEPPKPVIPEPPQPVVPEPQQPVAEPPKPSAPAPSTGGTAAKSPIASAPGPSTSAVGPGAFTLPPSGPRAAGPTSGAPGPALASTPPEGVTQHAIPRGGYQVRPKYPSSARTLGIQGITLLAVFVARDGRVTEVTVKKSAGHPDLDEAAADAVRRWRFEPARRGAEAVAMWVLLPVEFKLR